MHYVLRGAVVNFHSIPALKFEKEGGGGGGVHSLKRTKLYPTLVNYVPYKSCVMVVAL